MFPHLKYHLLITYATSPAVEAPDPPSTTYVPYP